MKIHRRTALFAVASSAAVALAFPSAAQVNEAKKIQKEADAIAFVEKSPKVLEAIGGAGKVADIRPLRATGHGEVWVVLTQAVADPKNPSAPKRALLIELNADSGEVIDISPF